MSKTESVVSSVIIFQCEIRSFALEAVKAATRKTPLSAAVHSQMPMAMLTSPAPVITHMSSIRLKQALEWAVKAVLMKGISSAPR